MHPRLLPRRLGSDRPCSFAYLEVRRLKSCAILQLIHAPPVGLHDHRGLHRARRQAVRVARIASHHQALLGAVRRRVRRSAAGGEGGPVAGVHGGVHTGGGKV